MAACRVDRGDKSYIRIVFKFGLCDWLFLTIYAGYIQRVNILSQKIKKSTELLLQKNATGLFKLTG